MKIKKFLLSAVLAMGTGSVPTLANPGHGTEPVKKLTIEDVKKQLEEVGHITGEVHGAVPHLGLYLFTFRNPDNFFDYILISMITRNPAVKAKLADLIRHDRIQISGKLGDNPSPQPHLKLSDLKMLKKYVPSKDMPKHDYEVELPDDLLNKTKANFLVHGVIANGAVLALEYGDAIVPAFVEDTTLSSHLWRNDKIEMSFEIQDSPGRPVHIIPSSEAETPIVRYDTVEELHWEEKKERLEKKLGKTIEDTDPRLNETIEGELVLFLESPQVRFDVWAIQTKGKEDGIIRNFTVINFEDMKLFKAIRDKLDSAWRLAPDSFVSGRNKLVNTKVKVRVTGKLNSVDPNQANVQVMPTSLEQVEILE